MQYFIKSDKGKVRDNNEDFASAKDNILIVADGMGGHNAGEVASKVAAETAMKVLLKGDKDRKELIKEAIDEANREVLALATDERSGMGTTIDICVVDEETLYLGHVGDSRVYIIRDGRAEAVTHDHSYVEMLIQKGEITKEEAKNYPMKNMITKAIGVGEKCEGDIFEFSLKENDKILLCTDGLTNMVSDGEIAKIISREENCEKAASELVKAANEAGGMDNITCLLAYPYTGKE